jgi:hypothetical protein
MQSLVWYVIWLLLLAGVSTPVPAQPAPLGEEVILLNYGDAAGDGVAAANGELQISFVDVIEDSRCPSDVTCAWAGEVQVALEAQVGGQPPQVLTLGGPTDSRGLLDPGPAGSEAASTATVAGYELQLLSVTPYPAAAGAPPREEEYQISLLVRTPAAE